MAVINITGTLHVHLHTADLSPVMALLEAIELKVSQAQESIEVIAQTDKIVQAAHDLDQQQKGLTEAMAAANPPSSPQQP